MRDLCVIGLIFVCAPWVTGIGICLWKYFSILWDKLARWFELKKVEKKMQKLIDEYYHWYTAEEVAIFEALIYDSKYKRSRLFSINDLKIWKAFI